MAQRSAVPKFGNWESEGEVPYTVYFDNARKDKRGRHKGNPNDPEENLSLHSRDMPPYRAPTFRNAVQSRTVGEGVARPNQMLQSSKEDSDLNQSNGSPWRHDIVDRKAATASPNLRYGDNGLSFADSAKRNGRVGADRSLEQSPLHHQYLTKTGGRGNGMPSPMQERKLSESNNIAGRPRMRPIADETALPKFGDWDVTNPASADGFTRAFNQARNERKGGSAKVSIMNGSPNDNEKQFKNEETVVCSCFSWCRK